MFLDGIVVQGDDASSGLLNKSPITASIRMNLSHLHQIGNKEDSWWSWRKDKYFTIMY